MADQVETVRNTREICTNNVPNEAEREESEKLLTSVIFRRKTTPAKCMAIRKEIIRLEIKRLNNVEIKIIKMEEKSEKQKFMKLLHKLKRSKPSHICLNDLHEAEKKVVTHLRKLKEINEHLRRRRHRT